MKHLMCRSCGRFVAATPDGEGFVPVPDACPDCGATDFVDATDREPPTV